MPRSSLLRNLINQYINEQIELRRIDPGQVSTMYSALTGNEKDVLPMGYCSFLEASGISRPELRHLTSHYIGSFWEYVANYHGLIPANQAMGILRSFWNWAKANGYIPDCPEPADLQAPALKPRHITKFRLVAKSYRI